jgi:hypothetical protein
VTSVQLTLDKIEAVLSLIRSAAQHGDFEAAHGLEIELHRDVLTAIAKHECWKEVEENGRIMLMDDSEHASEFAALALTSLAIEFTRVSA